MLLQHRLFFKLPSSRLSLRSRRKCIGSDGTPSTRVKSSKDTLTEVMPLCIKIGVTRIADITSMDRLCVPNYSAVLPGTEDSIWVYSGKGTTKLHAKTSALMEAIERYSSLSSTCHRGFIQGSYYQLSKSYDKVLHPAEVVEAVNQNYHNKDTILDFLIGSDLLANQKVLVPAEVALYRYSPKFHASHAFSHFHTNGLASGNVLEEAISHALCEVIERDAVSIADLCASSIPYNILEKIAHSLKKQDEDGDLTIRIPIEDKFIDDPSIFPDVDISEIAEDFDPVRRLVKRFVDADISLLIKDVTQKDIGIPTFVASSVEWITPDYGYFVKGSGTHPDSRIALIRAITEVSQTRAANIQGARDDLKKIEYKENDEIHNRKWQFMHSWPSTKNRNIIKFRDIKTHMNKDILEDINLILYGLKKSGLKRAIIVDLTDPSIGIPVVRAVVPGLETFAITQSLMGRRAKQYFRRLHHS